MKFLRRVQILIFESILFGSRGQKIKKRTILTDMHDWPIVDDIFEYCDKIVSSHTVDRFAT